ncbi:MAG: hypothetical protein RBR43_07210 [Desulfuromonadaceae bacterium]|nr:hypothetical protein [Desulfuromonas sp.]MDY0185646.1 hypothetical protein [Desulfuromonadaceae bacterium]
MSGMPDRRRVNDGRYADDRRGGRNRRRGPDFLRRLLPIFAALSWGCMLLAFFVMSMAKPETLTFVGVFSKKPVSSLWDLELLNYVFWLLFGAIIVAVSGYMFNLMRTKRKGDNLYISLILVSLFASAFLVWLLKL